MGPCSYLDSAMSVKGFEFFSFLKYLMLDNAEAFYFLIQIQ